MEYHSDYKNLFFSREEVFSILKNSGFPMDPEAASLDEKASNLATVKPSWMKLYAAKGALRPYEAAWILSGDEPPTAYPSYYDIHLQEELRHLHVFEDLAGTGEIAFKPTEWHRDDEPKTWLLDHYSILKWCRRTGYEWPLESLMQTKEAEDIDLHPRREATYQRILAALLALQYGRREIDQPYPLADEVLADCQLKGMRAPGSRSTLGPIFEKLPPVQMVSSD